MRSKIRTVSKALSTLVALLVLVAGASLEASAQGRGRDWGRSHNRGNHYGWTRGRRTGQNRDDFNWRRRLARREIRRDRRELRRDRRDYRRDVRRSRYTRYNRNTNYFRTRYYR